MNALTDTCPPLEDIAAFLDGKLSERERAHIVAHLADCESCYAVFAGAARFQLEEDEEEAQEPATVAPAKAKVVPFHRRPAVRRMLPLAAVLVLGLTLVPLYLQSSRIPVTLSADLVDPAGLESLPTGSIWNEDKRGDSEAGAYDASFEVLLGAHLFDLHLTLSRGDKEESDRVLGRINGVIDELLFVDEQAAFYKRARVDLEERRRTLNEVAEEAARVEADLMELYSDSSYIAFGKWTEAGRLSALAKSPAFFEDRDNRRFPRWLLRNEEEHLDEGIVQTLRRIRDVIGRADPAELPYPALAQHFEAILRHYQGEADAATAHPP